MASKADDLKNFVPEYGIIDRIHKTKDSELGGIVVFVDLTGSTRLKEERKFPAWFADYEKFHEMVMEVFKPEEVKWYKFLGDAYLFFFFYDQTLTHEVISHSSCEDVYAKCKQLMSNFWEKFKKFRERKRGEKKHIEFREITIAIDCGGSIVNWYEQIDDAERGVGRFDPVGPTVDRCFRISSLAGPGQLLVSKDFHAKISNGNANLGNEFQKIHLENSLKGFSDENEIYLSIPPQEQLEYFLGDGNVELVESAPHMTTKAKLALFRRQRNAK